MNQYNQTDDNIQKRESQSSTMFKGQITSVKQKDISSLALIMMGQQQQRSENYNKSRRNSLDETATYASELSLMGQFQQKNSQSQPFNGQTNIQDLPDNGVFFQRHILRQNQGLISTWQKFYIVLTNSKLYFFTDSRKVQLSGCINLKYLQTQLIDAEKYFELRFKGDEESIYLAGQTEEETNICRRMLDTVIEFRQKCRKVTIKKFNRHIYEQKDFVLEKDFLNRVQTGDILLVSSQNSFSYLQKFVTHSDYNHVALLYKYKGQLKVFEANQDDGVEIYEWKHYLKVFKDHKKFAWRRLNFSSKSSSEQKLKQLAKKYIGNNYSISTSKLLKRKSDDDEKEETKRQFFCSELIAKIYKIIGILQNQKSSARYWPINFTSRGELNLLQGAYLSLQKTILLEKHLKL